MPQGAISMKSSRRTLPHPPQIKPSIEVMGKRFRFQLPTTTANQVAVTVKNLLQLLVFTTGAANSNRLLSSVRLRRVEVWSIPTNSNTGNVFIRTAVQGLGQGPENLQSDVAVGVEPAYVSWRPAAQSNSALWQSTGINEAQALFEVSALAGAGIQTFLDLTMDFIMFDDDSAVAGPVPAGATAGTLYCCTLDGSGVNGLFIPVDYLVLP
jgi:hypothetical protein